MSVLSLLRDSRSGTQVDRVLADAGIAELKPSGCTRCDFGSGHRGMDRCAPCDGTGEVFRVGGRSWPNTEQGYIEATITWVEEQGL